MGTVVGNFANGLESEISFGNEILFDEDGGVDEIKVFWIFLLLFLIQKMKSLFVYTLYTDYPRGLDQFDHLLQEV